MEAATGDQPGWRDLALNRPGQAARAKSVELRRDAPVKSILARLMGVRREERDWRVGAEGEEEVAWRLRKLGQGWHLLHAVPVGEHGADIDHVVIGPPGVFTLNTKNHSGNRVTVTERCVYVNGQKTDYLKSARFEGQRASRLLSAACGRSVDVQPVIGVMAAQFKITSEPSDVLLVSRKSIAQWLIRRPVLLPSERVDAIYGMARRDTSWRRVGD